MGIIKLKTIIYLSCSGIVLNGKKPFVEATDENLSKLATYIYSGHLEHVKENEEKTIEEIKVEAIEETLDLVVEPIIVEEEVFIMPERIQEYTKEQLKVMNKSELVEILKEKEIVFKKNASVSSLEELILSNQ
ncbi:MAG: hypothetical protein ACRC5T_03895 [Cetobacterium sp.]